MFRQRIQLSDDDWKHSGTSYNETMIVCCDR